MFAPLLSLYVGPYDRSPTVHGSLVQDLVRQTGAAVVFPYYTPAPEAHYPKQFEQAYGVL